MLDFYVTSKPVLYLILTMLFLNHCFSLGKCSCHIQLSFGGNQVGWSCFNSTKVNWSWWVSIHCYTVSIMWIVIPFWIGTPNKQKISTTGNKARTWHTRQSTMNGTRKIITLKSIMALSFVPSIFQFYCCIAVPLRALSCLWWQLLAGSFV